MSISRRSVLGLAAAGLAGSALSFGLLEKQPKGLRGWSRPKTRAPKNIIFCVVDGMATQVLSLADHYSQHHYGKASYWASILDDPRMTTGWQDTASLSSVVTDSAAASSTWGSGRRIWNGMLNMYPDKTALAPIGQLLRTKGMKTGLVTTTTITHATPAGFTVSIVSRDLEPLIAEEYLKVGPDVLLGGGDKFFDASKRKDGKDLYGAFAKAGYEVVKDRAALKASKGDKVLGIFDSSHLPFSVDRDNSPAMAEKVPTLAEMTRIAIDKLKGSKEGFLLQIEGGKVDHAGHGTDVAGQVHDQLAFEEAVRVAIEFAERDGDTLVIITADHATGGPSLNGAGEEYADSLKAADTIAGMKCSLPTLIATMGLKPKADRVADVVASKYGIKLKKEEAETMADILNGKSPFAFSEFLSGSSQGLSVVLGNYSKVLYTSGNHTAEYVPVTAFGPWSESLGGLTRNVDFNEVILATRGIENKNPTMDYATAAKHMEKLKETMDAEWFAFNASHDDECSCHVHIN